MQNANANANANNGGGGSGDVEVAPQAECILLEKHVEVEEGQPPVPPSWDCELTSPADVAAAGNRRFIQIDGLPEEVQSKAQSGRTTLLLPGSGAKINGNAGRLTIPPGLEIATGYQEQRGQRPITPGGPEDTGRPDGVGGGGGRRLAALGNKETVVVYVNNNSASGAQTTSLSKATLSNRVFGTTGDSVNLRSQYFACSAEAIDFEPSTRAGVGADAEAGIVTVNTAVTLTADNNSNDMANAVTDQLEAMYGGSVPFDHVLICAPPGTFDAVAWAYLNNWLSIYNDNWCQEVSAQMHEVGHNLGLGHANEGDAEYNDQSGMVSP